MKILKFNYKEIFNYLYILLFTALPLMFVKNIIDPVLIPRQFLLTAFLLISALLILSGKNNNISPFLKLLLPKALLTLVLFYWFSVLFSINKAESFYCTSKLSLFFAYYLITTFLLISKKLDINFLIKGIIFFNLILIIISIYQIVQIFISGLNIWENIERIKSSSTNKNFFSSALFLAVPFLLCSFRLNRIYRNISALIIVIDILFILLLQTRAAWLALLCSSLILSILFYSKNISSALSLKNINLRKYFILNLILILIIVFSVLGIFLLKRNNINFTHDDNIWRKEPFSLIDNTRTLEPRKMLWLNSLKMFRDNPFTGVGAGNWQINLPKYGLKNFSRGAQNNVMTYQRPHNDYLWVLSETGIFGFLCFILILFLGIFYVFKIMNSSVLNDDKLTVLFMGLALVGYIIISCFDFPLERIEHQVLFMTLLSIITYIYYENVFSPKHESAITAKFINPRLFIFSLLPLLIFSFIICIYRLSGLSHTKNVYDVIAQKNWYKLADEAASAENYFYNLDPSSTPLAWYKGVALSSLNDNDAALNSFINAYNKHPYSLIVLNNIGSCYELQKKYDLAIKFYSEALRIAPKFEEVLLNLSATYYNMEDYEKAFNTINQVKIITHNKNYLLFLYPILKKKIELFAEGQINIHLKQKLLALSEDKNSLISLYRNSRIADSDLCIFVLDTIKMENDVIH